MASCPPSAAPDRPRTARIAGAGEQRPVPTLASGLPDRMDRGQVQDVDAELGELRQLLTDAVEATPRAREQLIPGAEARAHTVDVEQQRALERGRCRAIGVALEDTEQLVPEGRIVLGGLRRVRILEQRERSIDHAPVLARARARRHRAAGPRPRRARSISRAGRNPACAAAPRARWRTRRSTPRSSIPSARACSTVKPPAHRTPSRCASIGRMGASCQRRVPGPRQRTAARTTSWPSRNMSAETSTRSPSQRLGG